MLKRSHKISRREFLSVSPARPFHTDHLSIRAVPAESTQFSVVASKKVARTAVSRNRLKRRVYAALENAYPRLNNSHRAVFYAKKGAEELPYSAIQEEVLFLLKKAGML